MSTERVRNFFVVRGLKDPVFEMQESGATVELAAKTIGVPAELIAKTLSFKVDGKTVLVVAKGDARVDNKKFKQQFNTKARMLSAEEVEAATGHPVGGVCPFGLSQALEIYMDISVRDFEYIYPAAGSKFTALKITPLLMQQLTNAVWVDVCQ